LLLVVLVLPALQVLSVQLGPLGRPVLLALLVPSVLRELPVPSELQVLLELLVQLVPLALQLGLLEPLVEE
jgi:hypothetical protein